MTTTQLIRRPVRSSLTLALSGLLASGLLVLSGCAGTSDSSSQARPASEAQADRGADGGGAQSMAAPSAGTGASGSQGRAEAKDGAAQQGNSYAAAPAANGNRKVSRGEVVVTVKDLTAASSQVRSIAGRYGGYVTSESMGVTSSTSIDDSSGDRSSGYGSAQNTLYVAPGEARIVLRVKPEHTTAAMDAIAGVGSQVSRWRSDEDVELAMVDLESRTATLKQSIADLRGLLAKATSLSDIITLENELSERTSELESLQAQHRAMADQVAYSTVTAVVRTAERSVEEESEAGFVGGLKAGLSAMSGSFTALLTIIGALLPFAVLALLIGWPVSRWVRPRLQARRVAREEARAQAVQRAQADRDAHQRAMAPMTVQPTQSAQSAQSGAGTVVNEPEPRPEGDAPAQ